MKVIKLEGYEGNDGNEAYEVNEGNERYEGNEGYEVRSL